MTFIIVRTIVKLFLPLRFCGRHFVCFSYLICRPCTIARELCLISSVLCTYEPSIFIQPLTSYKYPVVGLKYIPFFRCFEFETSEPHEQPQNSHIELCENLKMCSDHGPGDKFTTRPTSERCREKNRLIITFLSVSY